ncbi:helicase HerA domain-containing protein [Gordonia sp. DT101]|uniref:helicase HerA domain-containing protein n=1 Tax=Gordonia sp. DT101 TaxID=3416545 RepID=UPI003CF9B9EE
MEEPTRQALESIRLDWAATPDDVWGSQAPLHVRGLHEPTVDEIVRAFDDARRSSGASPLGVAVRGPAGAGKTHLLGQVRERVQAAGGYFFLVKLLDGEDFWRSVLVAMLEDLSRPTPTHRSQLAQLLDRLGRDTGVTADDLEAVTGTTEVTPKILDRFITSVYTKHSRHRRRSQHILRALVLTEADDFATKDLGEAFLHLDIDDGQELAVWGIRNARLGYHEIVENISRIIAFDNASVLAIDQIDTLIEAAKSENRHDENAVEKVAHGLMSTRETMSRTAAVVSCITAAWDYLENRVMASATDRFRQPPHLQRPSTADFGRALLAKRFAPCFAEVGFRPPYPTWPVTDRALAASVDFTPRELMRTADRHIGACLRADTFAEMTSLTADQPLETMSQSDENPALVQLDRRFDELLDAADPAPAVALESEDRVVPPLLQAGLASWIEALGDAGTAFKQDPKPSPKAVLHGRIRRILDPETDAEQSWAFRGLSASHHRAVQARLANATTAAGLSRGSAARALIVLRRRPWPSGARTQEMVAEFEQRGGRVIAWTDEDIRVLSALDRLRSERSEFLTEWIARRNPAARVGFIKEILEPTVDAPPPGLEPVPGPTPAERPQSPRGWTAPESTRPVDRYAVPALSEIAQNVVLGAFSSVKGSPPKVSGAPGVAAPQRTRATAPEGTAIPLGSVVGDGRPVHIGLEALRKHTAIFAGSGSGKTVLIRRIVEEAALQGVSSIVLDVNNDLARLGTAWPPGTRDWHRDDERPDDRRPDDRRKAADYLAGTEVVVFTPGRSNGRPLSFRPLPDFAGVLDDADEFTAAVESAAAGLIPRAMVAGKTAKSVQSRAVLHDALRYFGRHGGGGISDFIDVLSDLPDEVSGLMNAHKFAGEIAENLKAARANDPLFGGHGDPADPGLLLTPSPGFRARVSVINLAALSSDDKRNNFVNELQMALFAWIKKNPAAQRPLGGLFVMDEAQNYAPSDRMTACTQSTLALVSQARKYGLGLVFATQAPKGLDNKIPGNASTQFFGLLNSPAQISAAQGIAKTKGSVIPDVGRLSTGVFYTALDGGGFAKTQTPLCLSYHPKSPPTEDEVVAIARGDR